MDNLAKIAEAVREFATSATLALVPVFGVFIFFQRYLVEGISTAGLSGR